jgi:hypothetical protein
MEISPQVQAISDVLSTFADGALHDRRMMERFLQHAHDRGRPDSLGELAFAGKYLTRLQITFSQQTAESELHEKLEQEFSHAIHDFHAKVVSFVADAETEFRDMVEHHYLAITEDALRSLMHLATDFTWMKNWELDMTQGNSQSGAGGAGNV